MNTKLHLVFWGSLCILQTQARLYTDVEIYSMYL